MATVKVSNKRQRDMQRAVHIVGGLFLMLYVYSPAGAVPIMSLLMQVVVMPVVILTGVLMWQLPRLRKFVQGRRVDQGSGPVEDRRMEAR